MPQGELVLAPVVGVQLAPVARGVAREEAEGILGGLPEGLQGPGSGQDPPQGEGRRHRPRSALKAVLGGFEATLGPIA